MNYLGLGFGGGKGSGKSKDSNSEKETTISRSSVGNSVSVRVSGSDYYYNDGKVTLKELEGTIQELGDNVVVTITDDGAIQNAMEALTDMIGNNKADYVIQSQ